MPSSGKLIMFYMKVNLSGTPAHARLWINAEGISSEFSFNEHFILSVLAIFTQQQWLKQSGAVLHPHIWCSQGNSSFSLMRNVANLGTKRFTSKHIEMTILIKVGDRNNLITFVSGNWFTFINKEIIYLSRSQP